MRTRDLDLCTLARLLDARYRAGEIGMAEWLEASEDLAILTRRSRRLVA